LKKLQLILATAVLSLILTVPTFAAPKFALPQRDTSDADIVNSDITGYTGRGVYIAVLDTGLVPFWRDYFPQERIATKLGKGFVENVQVDPQTGELVYAGFVHETSWVGSTYSTHGTHVISTIIGYNYYAPSDIYGGFPLLRPLFVKGIAPEATIIPVKVLSDYVLPGYAEGKELVFGTYKAVAAGIIYATDLKVKGYEPMIISMSLGGSEPSAEIEDAIDYAIDNGVIVVAGAGNAGDAGMDWPGAYPQVISAGACGWKYEWYWPYLVAPDVHVPVGRYRLWWLQDGTYGYNDIAEPTQANDVYITDFSGREKAGQELDVVAPGSWVRGPMPDGFDHLPWWSNGLGWYFSVPGLTNFYYVGGTSMATPHVSATAAQMLEKNPTLDQATVESIIKTTALSIPANSMTVWDLAPTQGWYTYSWGSDATGSGLIQANAAVASVPSPP
jgi:subtilisin family serine protease